MFTHTFNVLLLFYFYIPLAIITVFLGVHFIYHSFTAWKSITVASIHCALLQYLAITDSGIFTIIDTSNNGHMHYCKCI